MKKPSPTHNLAQLPTDVRCQLAQKDIDERGVKVGFACETHEISRMTLWRWNDKRRRQTMQEQAS